MSYNLIYIFADQLRYQSCGFAGDPLAHTPNMDRLAAESTNCINAISNTPVCAAYRASLFTGKHQSSHGMVINELRLSPDHDCFGHVLTKAGYETSYIGKWHLWANELGNHRAIRNAFTPPGPYRLGFDGYWAGYNFSHHSYKGVYFEDSCEPRKYDGYEPDIQTDMAIDRIGAHGDSPFALFLSWGPPHDPWGEDNVKPGDWEQFKNKDIPRRPNVTLEQDGYADNWATMDDAYRDRLDDNVRGYYAQTSNIDWNLGRILDAVDEAGIRDNTILVFTSDHGEMFGSQGRRAKNIFYDEASHVPLLTRQPDVAPSKVDTCISTVDLMPTLLGLLGLSIPDTVEGVNLSETVSGRGPTADHTVTMQGMGTTAAWKDGHEWRGLRDLRYTYAVYLRDQSQHLYDNIADPYQMTNLVTDASRRNLVQHYSDALDTRLANLEDEFKPCTYYEAAWMKDRNILRGARGGTHDLDQLQDVINTHFPGDALERSVDD